MATEKRIPLDDVIDSIELVTRKSQKGNDYDQLVITLSNGMPIEMFLPERSQTYVIKSLLPSDS